MRFSIASSLAVAFSALVLAGSAQAAIVTYTNQGAFVAAAGPLTGENFNSVASEVSFQVNAVTIGELTFQGYGFQLDRNYVDVPPHQFPTLNIDGTTNINAATFSNGGFDITFARPVTAFGASFGELQNLGLLRTNILVLGNTLTPPIQAGSAVTFFGFVSDTPFTTIRFAGTANPDGFSLDNALFSALGGGGVPEPATWALMIAGFGMVGGALRRRRAVGA